MKRPSSVIRRPRSFGTELEMGDREEAWLDTELDGCDLADQRLTKLLRKVLTQLGGDMGQSIPPPLQEQGKIAWFALVNRNIRSKAFRSRGQTRPRLLRVCRAPDGVACSHGGGAPARRVRKRQVQQPDPHVGPFSGTVGVRPINGVSFKCLGSTLSLTISYFFVAQ